MAVRCFFMQLFGLTLDKVGNGIHSGSFIGIPGSEGGKIEGSAESLKGRGGGISRIQLCKKEDYPSGFQMPLHYPRYKKEDFESMEDWKLDMLLIAYGLSFKGTIDEKRAFAMGTFLWPDQM